MSTLGLERSIHRYATNDGDGERVGLGTQSWESRHGARLVARDRPGESGTDDDLDRKVIIQQDDVGSSATAKHAAVVETEESSGAFGDHRQRISEGNSAPLDQVAHGCVKPRHRASKTHGRAFLQDSDIANLVGDDGHATSSGLPHQSQDEWMNVLKIGDRREGDSVIGEDERCESGPDMVDAPHRIEQMCCMRGARRDRTFVRFHIRGAVTERNGDAGSPESTDCVIAKGMLRRDGDHLGVDEFGQHMIVGSEPFRPVGAWLFPEERTFEVQPSRFWQIARGELHILAYAFQLIAVERRWLRRHGRKPRGHTLCAKCFTESHPIALCVRNSVASDAVDLCVDESRRQHSWDDIVVRRCVTNGDDRVVRPFDGGRTSQDTVDECSRCREPLDHANYCKEGDEQTQPL